jgi:nitrite reductase/ring-hydroxylating ferredoxin subunit
MGDARRDLSADPPAFDPRTTPLPRRRVLLLIGAGAVAAGGMAVLLESCAGPPVTVTLDFDLDTLEVDTPTKVDFPVPMDGGSVEGSVWFVKRPGGEILDFDPRCTHALCSYRWEAADRRFRCHCHEGSFAIDGAVLGGPPPRPLDRFPMRITPAGIELDVPGSFRTPRESLPG